MEHDIKKDGFYSVLEILDYKIVNVSERTLQNYGRKHNIRKIDNFYRFTGHQVIILRKTYEKRAKNKAKKIEMAERNKRLLAAKIASIKVEYIDGDHTKSGTSSIKEISDAAAEARAAEEEDEVTIPMEDFEKLQIIVKQRDVNLNKIEMLTQRIEEYQTDIKYFKDTLTDAMSSMKESLKSIQQQNFIQAKEKGFDKK